MKDKYMKKKVDKAIKSISEELAEKDKQIDRLITESDIKDMKIAELEEQIKYHKRIAEQNYDKYVKEISK